jgi:hypothetical protein
MEATRSAMQVTTPWAKVQPASRQTVTDPSKTAEATSR